MGKPYGQKRGGYGRSGGGKVQMEPATALHEAAVKLFDKGDGHGAVWAAAAEAAFRCAFAFLQHVPAGNPDRAAMTQRVHDVAYTLLVGNIDSGTPYRSGGAKPAGPAFTMGDPAPGHDPGHG